MGKISMGAMINVGILAEDADIWRGWRQGVEIEGSGHCGGRYMLLSG